MMMLSSMTDEQLTAMANSVKEHLILKLEDEGKLTASAEEILGHYAVVLHRRGFFGSIIDRLLFKETDKNALLVSVVRIV